MFELPDLPFDPMAFEGMTSAETFAYHHGKHHAGYVKNSMQRSKILITQGYHSMR